MLSVLVTGFSSCSKDDNEPDVVGYNDFYIECECEGGGFDASTLADIENALNGELLEVKLYKLTKEDAIKTIIVRIGIIANIRLKSILDGNIAISVFDNILNKFLKYPFIFLFIFFSLLYFFFCLSHR